MSRIYFHSEHDDAEVRGSERAMAGGVCSRMLMVSLHLDSAMEGEVPKYLAMFPANHYIHGLRRDAQLKRSIETAVAVGQEFFTAALNTALVMGSDAVKLLARLHGQCEIHAYVRGENRAWLAGIIERGRVDKILRANMGWEAVVELLRSRDDGPVVTSYSVCEQFPNAEAAGFQYDEENPDAWYDLPGDEQWSRAIEGLLKEPGLEMTPERWADFYFGDGQTGFDLLDLVYPPASPPEKALLENSPLGGIAESEP
jgi:hypothetical protein